MILRLHINRNRDIMLKSSGVKSRQVWDRGGERWLLDHWWTKKKNLLMRYNDINHKKQDIIMK